MDRLDEEKLNEIKEEQKNYQPTMTVEEMRKKIDENDEKIGMEILTLEKINQYISEVRNGCK